MHEREHKRRKARKLLISAGLSRLRRSCGALTLVPPAYAGGWQTVAAYAAKTIHSEFECAARAIGQFCLDRRGGCAIKKIAPFLVAQTV